MLGVTPLIEDMDLEFSEAPAEVDVLLRRQILTSKQQYGMLFVGVVNNSEAVVVDGPGEIEAADLGAQRRAEWMYGNCHDEPG